MLLAKGNQKWYALYLRNVNCDELSYIKTDQFNSLSKVFHILDQTQEIYPWVSFLSPLGLVISISNYY